jgi:hypothetical protein
MATLQIVFHCLCLYVRDEENRIVHVLMPATKGHHADHFALLKHPSFPEPQVRSLAGWALALRPTSGSAQLRSLDPQGVREILDLTAATAGSAGGGGRRVKKELVTGRNGAVTARITLGAGGVVHTEGETFWGFDNRMVKMVTRVYWEMDVDDVEARLDWSSIGASGDPPLESLSKLGGVQPLEKFPDRPDERMGYRIDVYHTTLADLKPEEVEHHFRAFYDVLEHTPAPDELPRNRQEGPRVHCGSGQAQLA